MNLFFYNLCSLHQLARLLCRMVIVLTMFCRISITKKALLAKRSTIVAAVAMEIVTKLKNSVNASVDLIEELVSAICNL